MAKIYKQANGWVLVLPTRRLFFERLIDAIQTAELLQIHVANRRGLPL